MFLCTQERQQASSLGLWRKYGFAEVRERALAAYILWRTGRTSFHSIYPLEFRICSHGITKAHWCSERAGPNSYVALKMRHTQTGGPKKSVCVRRTFLPALLYQFRQVIPNAHKYSLRQDICCSCSDCRFPCKWEKYSLCQDVCRSGSDFRSPCKGKGLQAAEKFSAA